MSSSNGGSEMSVVQSWHHIDHALLEEGPLANCVLEIPATLPLHLVVSWRGQESNKLSDSIYRRVDVGKYASRNDHGQVRYQYQQDVPR